MNRSLKLLEKALKRLAKHSKTVSYTKGLLFAFLMMKTITFSEEVVLENKEISKTKANIKDSISDIKSSFSKLSAENDRLLSNSNLKLIQLMEQGDQVVKSPWSSWQFGMNMFLDDWRGTFKGQGDKLEKYPYEGIFTRSDDVFGRTTLPASKKYSLLSKESNIKSASTSGREDLNSSNYGLISINPVSEPIIDFAINVGIIPKQVNKGAITIPAKTATIPILPEVVRFAPVTPVITPPTIVGVVVPTVNPPATGNADAEWITQTPGGSSRVAPIAQQNLSGGTLTVTATGSSFTTVGSSITAVGESGNHVLNNRGVQNFNFVNSAAGGFYAAMKLVGGQEININDVTINYAGNGTAASGGAGSWLFHTDGHNDFGESTWVLNSGTKVNITGSNLIMYTSQYHTPNILNLAGNNIGFVNHGEITTSSSGSNNYLWLTLSDGGLLTRQMYFYNDGKLELNGRNDTFAIIGSEGVSGGGFSIINDGTFDLKGNSQKGIIVSDIDYPSAEILLNNRMNISGTGSNGVVFVGWADLDGGAAFSSSLGNNRVITLPGTSRESIFNINLSGTDNKALVFNNAGTNPFDIADYTLSSIDGINNTLVLVSDGIVNLKDANSSGLANTITISRGNNNIGIYKNSKDSLNTGAFIIINNSNNSIGLYTQDTGGGDTANTGKILVTGASVKGIISDRSVITSSGEIDVVGTALTSTDGSVGIVAINNGIVTSTGTATISVDGSASIGLFADSNANIGVSNMTLNTTGGAFNSYSINSGVINFGNNNIINTGEGSLAFFADAGGDILFNGATTANISGGTTSNTRGTAFYYRGSGYSTFDSASVATWVSNNFNNTLNNLTLNMGVGSRLFVTSEIGILLSNTNASNLFASATSPTIIGTDYKTFMLYRSQLAIDQPVNLDNPTDPYKQLEIAESYIINDNIITGTQSGQVAIAQENQITSLQTNVTLINNGTINLSGSNSTGIYAKYGIIGNGPNGIISVGDFSTAIYGTNNTSIINQGMITIGSNSTGIYLELSNPAIPLGGLSSPGLSAKIESSGNNSIGLLYKPTVTFSSSGTSLFRNDPGSTILLTGDSNVGMYAAGSAYEAENLGTITLGSSATILNPNVGMYTDNSSNLLKNSGTITTGNNAVGIYGYAVKALGGSINVGDGAVAIYSQSGNVDLNSGTISVGKNEAVGVYTTGSGQVITNNLSGISIGDTSFGFVNVGSNNRIVSNTSNVSLGNDSVYIYSNDRTGTITNSTNLASTGTNGKNYGIYSSGVVTNTGNMDFSLGIGNVGIYSVLGGTATNSGIISIGGSDSSNSIYGIGMAAGYIGTDTGNIINNGTINVNGLESIGMYATSTGSTATNAGTIVLNADNTIGIYVDEGAKATNSGTITTGVTGLKGVKGVYLGRGSTLNNTGTINIDSTDGVGVFLKGGTIANYGTITVSGSGAKPTGSFSLKPTTKTVGGVTINAPAGATNAVITVNSKVVAPESVVTAQTVPTKISASSIGMYVNTSGTAYTKPIGGLGLLTTEADLIIGAEASKSTNSRYIVINDPNILDPYNQSIIANPQVATWNIYSGSLTWISTATLNPSDGTMTNLYLVKIPYTYWAADKNVYNFTDGLEQRYGVEGLNSREKQLFNKLSSIGENEQILLSQAYDEMMGHQYANVQQRLFSTSNSLNKEFDYLRDEWSTVSKQSNKIKVFGMRGEYNTDTAGIIDYTNNTYGVAYIHEEETLKLGANTGWYTGIVQNKFKFKDIGRSKEDSTIGKLGIFKTMTFDNNGSFKWRVSGEGIFGYTEMNRRFLVVDEIFSGQSKYTSYGLALRNELSKEIRLTERTSLRPYGGIDIEYGRLGKIEEKTGEVRLEVKAGDYYSIKPKVGMEYKYKQPVFVNSNLTLGIGISYESELGKISDIGNKARVSKTTADYFDLRSEKENKKGNFKTDLKLGLENSRLGVTFNLGYDTNGNNLRGGVGFRMIY